MSSRVVWCLPLRGGHLGEGMESQMDSGPERRAWSQVVREGFLEDEETPGAG